MLIKTKNKIIYNTILLFSFVCLLWTSPGSLNAAPKDTPPGKILDAKFHPHELLIKFRPNVNKAQETALERSLGNAKVKAFKRPRSLSKSRMDHWRHIKLGKNADIKKIMEKLAKNPTIERIEPNFEVSINAIPNDPAFSNLWGLHNTGQTGGTDDADIDAVEAWDTHTGETSNVLVAVIDTGVDYLHEDLAENHWVNPGEIAGNGIDDDNNGYIDDVYGYDFYNSDSDPYDGHSHGTHVAGTIAAVGNNGIGVSGVSWRAKIMAVKFLSDSGSGYTTGAISSVLYAADMGARIMSNSWGGGGYSQALEDAIWTAYEANALFIAAAGNSSSNNDVSPHYPSSYDVPNVIAVAATDHNDSLAYFSSYGANTVELGAPGVDTYSTTPGNSYGYKSGTSMATPHVSGAAALLLSQDPTRTTDGLKSLILDTVDPIPALASNTITGGRLNILSAIGCLSNQYSLTVTTPTTNFSVIAGSPVNVTARLNSCGTPVADATVTVTFDNNDATINLYDDGAHNDGVANDGVYGGIWQPFTIGPVTMTVDSSHASMGDRTVSVSGIVTDLVEYTYQADTYNWIDTTTGTAYTLSDDSGVTIPVGFEFIFYGTPYSDVTISSNGFVTFGDAGNAWRYSNRAIPNTSAPNSMAALFWDDLYPPSGGTITSLLEGTAPNRRLTITWLDVPHISIGGAGSFQISLYEGTNDIVYQYLNVVFGSASYDNGRSATIGIEDQAGTNAVQISYNQANIVNNSAYRFIMQTADGNYRPVADAGGSYAVNVNEPVTLNGSNSSDRDGDALTYLWELGDGTTSTEMSPSHTYAATGTYTVTLIVSDGFVNSLPVSTTVTVVGRAAPTIVMTATPEAILGSPIHFDATGTVDPDGDAVQYNWDFGDGTTGAGESISHVYGAEGIYTATLTATDLVNASTQSVSVTITPNLSVPIATITGQSTSHWRNAFTLDGTSSYDPDGQPLNYEWRYGVSRIGTEPTLTTDLFNTPGEYTIDLVVSDGYYSSSKVSHVMTITNDAPVSDPGGPYTVHWGTPLSFNGNGSSDPNDDPITYSWNFGDNSYSSEVNPTHTYRTPGTYTLTLQVRDGVSSTTTTTTVTVTNTAPIANPGGPYTVHWSSPVTFNGLLSGDPDGDEITGYSWDFGDGTTGTGAEPVHYYYAVGNYTVSLIVSDGHAESVVATTIVTVTNTAPVANPGGPYTVHWGRTLSLNGGLSSDPDGDYIQSYNWNFGDGTTGTGQYAYHRYQVPGNYTIELTVSDGKTDSLVASTTVEVTNTAPVADPGGPYNGFRAKPTRFNAYQSSDPDGDSITSYQWDFGDGTTLTTTDYFVEHIYNTTGTFTASLTVSDGFAQSPPVSTTVVINNSPPVAEAGPTQDINEGTIATLDGSSSYDIDGTIVSYKWQHVGGKKVNLKVDDQAVVTFRVPNIPNGRWDAARFQLTVTDNDGATSTDTVLIYFQSVN